MKFRNIFLYSLSIPFLLVSSPAISAKYKTTNGCIFLLNTEPPMFADWSGECRNGFVHGKGTMTFKDTGGNVVESSVMEASKGKIDETSLANDERAGKVGASHSSNCPTTLTLSFNGKSEQLEVRALKEKLFTKAELDEYYESLLPLLNEAKAWVAQYNSPLTGSEYFTNGEYEPKHALYGCPAGDFNSNTTKCYMRDYGPIDGYGVIDYITPRIELYRCHKEAGWPSATDSQVAGNSEGSKKKKQCDVSAINNEQSVNGFNFKIVESSYGSKMIEGYGGPCRNVGVEKIVTQLESVKTFQKRSFGQNAFFSLMGNMPSSGNEFTYPIGPKQDYASSTNHFLQQWRDAETAGSPDARGIKETYMMNECIEMNHQKYQVALEDWGGANLKELRNCTTGAE